MSGADWFDASGAKLTEQAFQTITGIPSSTQLAAPAYGASA